jgi:hypothetical protein
MMNGTNEIDEKEKRELLKSDYDNCHDGYNSRDGIIPQEVMGMIALFGGLAALLKFTTDSSWPVGYRIIAVILIGIIGLAILVGLHLDIASNISCKDALRTRMKEIETILSGATIADNIVLLGIWKSIDDRKRLLDEKLKYIKLWKSKKSNKREYHSFHEIGLDTPYFIWVGRIAVVLWIVLVTIVLKFSVCPTK